MSDKIKELLERLKKKEVAKKQEIIEEEEEDGIDMEEDFAKELKQTKEIIAKEIPRIKEQEKPKAVAVEEEQQANPKDIEEYNKELILLMNPAIYRRERIMIETKKAESLEAIAMMLSKLVE